MIEKGKRINKEPDKHFVADPLTQYNFSYLMFVPSFKILSEVVPEKSLTENFGREKEKCTNKGTDKKYVADS